MHDTSKDKMKLVAELTASKFKNRSEVCRIIDIGGINSTSYQSIFEKAIPCQYDTMNVRFHCDAPQDSTILTEKAYDWPELKTSSYDVVVSGQTFEHIEYFWCSVLEMRRILKPGGLLALIAPSHWHEHRAPLDCYRFYADGLDAILRFGGLDIIYSYAEHPKIVGRNKCDAIAIASKPTQPEFPNEHYEQAHLALLKILPAKVIKDISRDKPTMQSSHSMPFEINKLDLLPGNAVSGVFTGNYSFHTKRETNPWWMVDLQRIYPISFIKIFNRRAVENRANDLEILFSCDLLSWDSVCKHNGYFGGIYDGKPLTILCKDESARYIRVQLHGDTIAHFDQVQVFSTI